MEKIKIGNVGFDVVTCTGFTIDEESIFRLKNRINNGESFQDAEVNVSNTNYVTIKDKPFFEFASFVSNLDEQRYGKLTVHAAREDGNNICNMNIENLNEKIQTAIWRLTDKYGLDIQQQEIKISRCELNKTIVINDEFEAYKRVLKLFALMVTKGNGKVNTVTAEVLRKALKDQGILVQKKTYAWRVYDKATEMFEKFGGITFDKRLLRIEKVYNSSQPFATDFETVLLSDLTNEKMEKVFAEKMKEIRKGIDNYLEEKMLYKPGFKGRDTTIPNIITSYYEWGKIMSAIASYEANYIVPCMLDATDMYRAIQCIMDKKLIRAGDVKQHYQKYMECYSNVPEVVTLWDEQRQLMNEFFDKVTKNYVELIKMRN